MKPRQRIAPGQSKAKRVVRGTSRPRAEIEARDKKRGLRVPGCNLGVSYATSSSNRGLKVGTRFVVSVIRPKHFKL